MYIHYFIWLCISTYFLLYKAYVNIFSVYIYLTNRICHVPSFHHSQGARRGDCALLGYRAQRKDDVDLFTTKHT